MKYTELNTEQARIICKNHKTICTECPLRRERTDKKGTHILFCYFIIKSLIEETEEKEEIKYTEEVEKELKELNDNK